VNVENTKLALIAPELLDRLEFYIDIILPAELWFCVDSAFNRNENQEYFLGGEGSWCAGLTPLPPSYADGLEI